MVRLVDDEIDRWFELADDQPDPDPLETAKAVKSESQENRR